MKLPFGNGSNNNATDVSHSCNTSPLKPINFIDYKSLKEDHFDNVCLSDSIGKSSYCNTTTKHKDRHTKKKKKKTQKHFKKLSMTFLEKQIENIASKGIKGLERGRERD